MANSRKPTHLKVMQGTERKDRSNPNEPIADTAWPVAPEYLSDVQVEKFIVLIEMIDSMNIANRVDVGMLTDLAVVECEIADDVVMLASDGPYYVPSKDSGIIRAHPAVARLTANRQRAQALRNEFGLSPAARSKVSALPTPERENPYAALDRMARSSRDNRARELDAAHAKYLDSIGG
jgi:P27 family predicted phage terminase small subunit